MTRLALPILRPVDGDGNPYPSGTLTFYDAGASSVLKTVYSDSGLSVSLGSTVTADGEGLFVDVYYSGDIRVVLANRNGTIQSTKDIYAIGNVDTADIVDGAVTTIKIDDNAVTLGKLLVLDNAKIITSNGAANSQVSVSGDATMSNTGVFTVSNNAITTAKILDANVTDAKLTTATQTKLGYIKNKQRVVAGLTADTYLNNSTVLIDWNYHSYSDLASLSASAIAKAYESPLFRDGLVKLANMDSSGKKAQALTINVVDVELQVTSILYFVPTTKASVISSVVPKI